MSVTGFRAAQHLSIRRFRNLGLPRRTKSLCKLPVIRPGLDVSKCRTRIGCEKYLMIASATQATSKLGELARISATAGSRGRLSPRVPFWLRRWSLFFGAGEQFWTALPFREPYYEATSKGLDPV